MCSKAKLNNISHENRYIFLQQEISKLNFKKDKKSYVVYSVGSFELSKIGSNFFFFICSEFCHTLK